MRKLRLSPEQIDQVFALATNQHEYLIGLYRLVYPDWDQIVQLPRWPRCGKKVWEYICRHCFGFDALHHPGVMAGGLWLNYGFSGDASLKPWEVDPASGEPVYQKEAC